jgi:hypothetical protein
MRRVTLSQFLVSRQRERNLINADLRLLLETIARASGAASTAVGMAPVFWVLAACLLGGAWFARKQIKS